MKIILPIAGKGSRFLNEADKNPEYLKPKPLIKVLGKPMVSWAIKSVPFASSSDLIFIAQREHDEKFGLGEKLKKLFGRDIKIVYTDGLTEGAACTVLLASNHFNTNEDILIMDTDHYFSIDWPRAIKQKEKNIQGIIAVFEDNNPKWSFTKIDEKTGYVMQVAEKNPISNYANVGCYYFSHGKDFIWAAKEMIKKNIRVNNEFYVAPVYNELIARGYKTTIILAKKMWELGTPADLEYFEKNFKNEDI